VLRRSTRSISRHGISPYATKDQTLNLLLVYTGDRPPLPHPLRPARPPEKRGRGAGDREETLKGIRLRESKVGGNEPFSIEGV
jgi:hypothetical protein